MKSHLLKTIIPLMLFLVVNGTAHATLGVFTWGNNQYGQLGDGTTTERHAPVQVSPLINATAIASGKYHSIALKADGTVRSWGLNGNGQLGDGTVADSHAPVQVTGLATVTTVAAGDVHSLAIIADKTVWTWGANANGQLGDDTTTDRHAPFQVSGLTGITAIAAGAHHSLALKSNGTVWGWGSNGNGQLGDDSTTDRRTPVQVSVLTGVIAIAAGERHSLALKADGTVWAWGYNGKGQLGDASLTDRWTPVKVSGLSGIVAIAGGSLHSLALTGVGAAWAWGDNGSGQLGDDTTDDRYTPVRVSLSGIAAAIAGGDSYTFVLKADGTAWMCGNNGNGQLGDGSTANRHTPVQVTGLGEVTAIAGKGYHALALIPFRILTTQLPFAITGIPYTQSLTTSTGTLPYSWSLSAGALPAGLTLNNSTGVISGTPAEIGTSSLTVMAIDTNGETAQRQFSLAVYAPLAITTTSLQTSVSNAGFSQTLTASGGLAPYTWSITAGSLPAGLTLNAASGAITGVPTMAGTSTITFKVTDALSLTASQQLSLTIYDPVSIGVTALPPGMVGAPYNWTVTTAGGIPPYSWGLVSGTLPPGLSLDAASGVISGKPSTVGDYSFTVRVTNGDATNPVKTLSIRIALPSYVYTWGGELLCGNPGQSAHAAPGCRPGRHYSRLRR